MTTAYRINSGARAGAMGAAMYRGLKLQRRTAQQPADGSWQRRAADAYYIAARDIAIELRDEMGARVRRLTGRAIAAETIYADAAQRLAVARVDGAVFRMQRGVLQIVRPCAHCGTGEFTSPAVESLGDLGYALTDWQPYCRDCEPVDSETWIYED